jgi:predicted transcriptional regulator
MAIHEKIRFLAERKYRPSLLRTLKSGPATNTDLMAQLSISESALTRSLTPLAEFGWIEKNQEGCMTITSAGRVVLREYENMLEDIDRGEFEFLGSSREAARPRLLRVLTEPATKPELASICEVSDATVYRAISDEDGFIDRGWAEKRDDGQYLIRPNGETVLDGYDDFAEALRIVEENDTILGYLEADPAPPLYVLEHSSAESSTAGVIHKGIDRFTELLRSRPDHIRGVANSVSKPLVVISRRLIEREVEMESVLADPAVKAYSEKYPDDLERSLEAEAITVYRHPENVEFQLGIFDDEYVLLGVYDEHGNLRGGIEGKDDDLVTWAIELFERHRDEARPVTEQPSPAID